MVTNVAVSVRERLKGVSKRTGRPFNELLQYFAMERLLYRVANSTHRDRFILKGALMMRVWHAPGARPTKDIDMLGFADNSLDGLQRMFAEICATPVPDDGVLFDASTIETRRIKEDADYEGVRLVVRGHLGTARLTVQIDVGFGDVVHPTPATIEFPTLLDLPAPVLRGYPRETVVAEKLHAMTTLEMLNSRMKDFYDVWLLLRQFEFDYAVLREAVTKTFRQRGTPMPLEAPVALTDVFAQDNAKNVQWAAFVRRMGATDVPPLSEIIARVAAFLQPVLFGPPQRLWAPGDSWR